MMAFPVTRMKSLLILKTVAKQIDAPIYVALR